jgi:hypothetical protein
VKEIEGINAIKQDLLEIGIKYGVAISVNNGVITIKGLATSVHGAKADVMEAALSKAVKGGVQFPPYWEPQNKNCELKQVMNFNTHFKCEN